MRGVVLLMLVGLVGGCASSAPRSEPSPVVAGSAGLPEPGGDEQQNAEPVRVVSAPEITTTMTQTHERAQPEEPVSDPTPAVASTPAPGADGPPEWYRDSAWIVEGRLMVAAIGEASDVLEARRAAVRAGREAYATEAAGRDLDPDAGVIMRTALLSEGSTYRAYVLVAQPAAE